jgi:hypothetical protein
VGFASNLFDSFRQLLVAGCYREANINSGGARHHGQSRYDAKNLSRKLRLLHEMQDLARDYESQADHDEERSAGNRRHLSSVQHQDVQNRRQ